MNGVLLSKGAESTGAQTLCHVSVLQCAPAEFMMQRTTCRQNMHCAPWGRASTPVRLRALLSALYALNVALAYLLMLVGPHQRQPDQLQAHQLIALRSCACGVRRAWEPN